MTPSLAAVLVDIHKYTGEALQLVAIVVLVWVALKNKTPLKRIAPVLLDVQFTLGVMVWLLEGKKISILHPICMLAAMALAHIAARQEKKSVVLGLWTGVLALLVIGILIAKGRIAPGLWLV